MSTPRPSPELLDEVAYRARALVAAHAQVDAALRARRAAVSAAVRGGHPMADILDASHRGRTDHETEQG